jgi:cephalosporin-C deacetylase-like acetyl esterase
MNRVFLILFLSIIFSSPAFAEDPSLDSLDVLPEEDFFHDQSIMLLKHLQRIPQERNWRRDLELARIKNNNDWENYKKRILRDYRKALGLPFPEKTPLRAELVGTLDRGSYRIEKIIYRSMPDILVTSNLYVPRQGTGPYPGIVFPCGHWHEGKAAEEYHSAALGLVSKGYVVLLFDPIGQGERCDYFTPEGPLVTGEPVIEHTLLANPLFLIGKHLMALRLWDTIRGIDYLVSRPEVDPDRIGITGNSGGGTVTLHLVPIEDRIKVAVPDGTVSAPRFELGRGHISDGEQNLPFRVPYGITHADLMMLAFPRPYRLIHESRGGVAAGARESFVQAQWLYSTLGHPEKMTLVETEWPHGFYKFSREKMYKWFNRWFYDREGGWQEPELRLERQEDLWCSKSGQILRERGKSIQQLIDEQAAALIPALEPPKDKAELEAFRARLSVDIKNALNNPYSREQMRVTKMGDMQYRGLNVEKLALYSEEDVYLPCLFYKPAGEEKFPVVILADSRGKSFDRGQLALALAGHGIGVFVVDLRGYGETEVSRRSARDRMSGLMAQTLGMDASLAYDGLYLGRSIFAMRVFDLQRAIEYIRKRPEPENGAIAIAGRNSCGPVALYAAALADGLQGVIVDSCLSSWRNLTMPGIYKYNFIDFLPGALKTHDLPQLAAACLPGTVWLVNPLDAQSKVKESPAAEKEYSFVSETSRRLGKLDAFSIQKLSGSEQIDRVYLEWALKTFQR